MSEARKRAELLCPNCGAPGEGCNCQSYNRPEIGATPAVVRRGVSLDACIADQIEALWDAGVETLGSCCGHAARLAPAPSVVLARPEQGPLAADVLRRHDPERPWQIIFWSKP